MQIGSIQASTSQDSFVMLVETWKNHLSKLVLLFTLQRGRCRPTMSPVVASLNNITNKGWVTIANNNGLSGHPWRTNTVVGNIWCNSPINTGMFETCNMSHLENYLSIKCHKIGRFAKSDAACIKDFQKCPQNIVITSLYKNLGVPNNA